MAKACGCISALVACCRHTSGDDNAENYETAEQYQGDPRPLNVFTEDFITQWNARVAALHKSIDSAKKVYLDIVDDIRIFTEEERKSALDVLDILGQKNTLLEQANDIIQDILSTGHPNIELTEKAKQILDLLEGQPVTICLPQDVPSVLP